MGGEESHEGEQLLWSHRQSPSVWGSTQDLASWDINDDEKGQGSALYDTGGAC